MKIEKSSTKFGLWTGGTLTTLKIIGPRSSYLSPSDFFTSIDPTVGIFFNFTLPRNNRRWSIKSELSFSSYAINDSYENHITENYSIAYTTELGASYLKLNNILSYKWPLKGKFIFWNLGISNGIILTTINSRIKKIKTFSSERIQKTLAFSSFRKHEEGFILGMGLLLGKFSGEVRYEASTGISAFANVSSFTFRYSLLLGYTFGH